MGTKFIYNIGIKEKKKSFLLSSFENSVFHLCNIVPLNNARRVNKIWGRRIGFELKRSTQK